MQLQITSATSPKSFSKIHGMIKSKAKKPQPQNFRIMTEWVTNYHILSYARDVFLYEYFLQKNSLKSLMLV